ncbi:hypothetical protein ARSQ2_02118 [Arsenophonus endosymbiont of Bemisia tabaci Q2]|nr:hypothetical protein ARSQ2_02118 [Arsenophonus endosymbiont of Bemisia tabaci Q2]
MSKQRSRRLRKKTTYRRISRGWFLNKFVFFR